MQKMKLKCNCCDGIYNSFDVHFTSACDNKCAHCVDQCYEGMHIIKPNKEAIVKTILDNKDGLDDVLFLGGEPCLFLDELLWCVKEIKANSELKVYVTTSVPKICYDKRDVFEELLKELDGLNISAQSHDECVADEIRKTVSQYDRQAFYNSLPYKDKTCLRHYDQMGFNSIKLSEIQHGAEYFVSFEKIFGIDLGSPYACGCQTYLDMSTIIPDIKTPVLLKRSCFMCEETLKANLYDGLKVFGTLFRKPKNKYGVIYEDGSLKKGWV